MINFIDNAVENFTKNYCIFENENREENILIKIWRKKKKKKLKKYGNS